MAESIVFLIGDERFEFAGPVSLGAVPTKPAGAGVNPIIGARVNGRLYDLVTELPGQDDPYVVEWIRFLDTAALPLIRHSTAHLTAQAIQRLFGESSSRHIRIGQGVGPPTDEGFFQDFALVEADVTLNDEELRKVEEMMTVIAAESLDIRRRVVSRDDARRLFSTDPLKQAIIDGLNPNEPVSVYAQGEYQDLCRGPHVPNTGLLRAFKLLRASTAPGLGPSGAHLIRVSGTAFARPAELAAELHRREEALRRDHRRIGPAMELFYLSEMAPGAVFFLKNGTKLRNILIEEKRRLLEKYGFGEVVTPTLFRREMWETSGHWDHYRDNMFTLEVGDEDEEVDYALKPMNCPGHILIYRSHPRSYRDLPIRMAEFGTVHRYERSGVLAGLHRVRTFTQDDAHLFVRLEQLHAEVQMLIKLFLEFYQPFGFENLAVNVSTRPADRLGSDSEWDTAEGALVDSLNALDLPFTINAGDGAFYGPKIDFHLADCIGRTWQCGTIQVDFQLPQRFDLSYVNSDGGLTRPVMIHPATMGSIERFMAILIEHFEGKFPAWLAPLQAILIPISEPHKAYAQTTAQRLREAGIRIRVEEPDERLSKKIRTLHVERVPYLLILGEKEEAGGTLSIRDRQGKVVDGVHVEEFISNMRGEMTSRELTASVGSFRKQQ